MSDTSTPDTTMATGAPADAANDAPLSMQPAGAAPEGDGGKKGRAAKKRSLPVRLLKYLGVFVGCLLLLVILVVAGAIAALQTQVCQDFLREKLNTVLLDEERGGMELTALSGTIPLDMRAGVRMKDREGVWLEIPEARLALDLTQPLTRIGLAVSAADGHLLRPAISEDAPVEAAPSEPMTPERIRGLLDQVGHIGESIPEQVPAVAITDVSVRSFRVERAVFAPAASEAAAPADGGVQSAEPVGQTAPAGLSADALVLDVRGALSVTPRAKGDPAPGWLDPEMAGRFDVVVNAVQGEAAPAAPQLDLAAAEGPAPADALERGPLGAARARGIAGQRVRGSRLEVVPGVELNGVVATVDIFGSLTRPGLTLATAVPEALAGIIASDTALSVVLPPETMAAFAAGEEGGLRVGLESVLDGEAVNAGLDVRCVLGDDGIVAALRNLSVRVPGITVDGDVSTVLPTELLAGSAAGGGALAAAPATDAVAAAEPEIETTAVPEQETAPRFGQSGSSLSIPMPAIPDLSGLPPVTGFLNVDARSFDLLSRVMPDLTLAGGLLTRVDLDNEAATGQAVRVAVRTPNLLVQQAGQAPMTISALSVDLTGEQLYSDAKAKVDVKLDAFSGMDMAVNNLAVAVDGEHFYSNPTASVDVTLDGFAGAGTEVSNLVVTLVGDNCYKDPSANVAVTVDSASASGMTVQSVTVAGTGSAIFSSPEAKVAVTVDSVSGNDMELRNITVDGSGQDFFNDPGCKVDVNLASFSGQGLNVNDARVAIEGALSSGIDFAVTSAGDVISAIKGHFTEGNVDISTISTSVTPYGVGIASTSPLKVAYSDESVKVTGLALDLTPGGSITAEAEVGANVCVAKGVIDNVDFTAYRNFVQELPEGALSADFDIKGTMVEPEGSFNVSVTGLKMDGLDLPALAVQLKTLLGRDAEGQRVLAQVILPQETLDALGGESSKIEVRLPLRSGASSPEPDMDGKLSGVVQYKGNVTKLWKLAGQPDRRLTGDIVVDAAVGGSLSAPDPSGGVQFVDGKFVDVDLGVQVDAINLKADLEGSGADLASRKAVFTLSASDGNEGTLKVTGSSGLTGDNLDVKTALSEFAPLRRRDLKALISGDVTVTGSATDPAVTGEVRVNKGWVSIEALDVPPSVETLPIEEDYVPGRGSAGAAGEGDGAAGEGDGNASSKGFGSIDLRFTMPPSFRVFGFGLDTVWKADLTIKGPLNDPSISGEVLANRGQLDLLSRKFKLSTGSVKFAGKVEPVLDIQMTREMTDLEACVNIAGTPRKIDLTLTSTPSMDQEEIISQMLFGKNPSELSQYELLELGVAVAKLAAFGTGNGIADAARDVTGLDVLSVGQSEGGGTRLEMGKYVMENVYVGVEKSTGDDDVTAGIVQMELGPRTNANVKSGGGNTEAGLQWKMDY